MPTVLKKTVLIIYALAVGFLSLRPAAEPGVEHMDKVMHIVVYGLFAFLGFIAAKNTHAFYWICAAIVTYGGLLEIAQSHIADRQMSFYDFTANIFGVLVAIMLITLVQNRSQKRSNTH